MKTLLLSIFLVLYVSQFNVVHGTDNEKGCKTLDSVYSVLLKLVQLEEKVSKQEATMKKQEGRIENLTVEIKENQMKESYGSTYIRWGRKTCPNGATEIYNGYTAGSYYTHGGGAANPLCLTKKPTWGKYTEKGENGAFIYGAEYATYEYSMWKYVQDHDVPCAVCRVPQKDVLMVPGSNICPRSYSVQYKGYLMAGHHRNSAPSQYICVDGYPETITRGHEDRDGYLLFFVQAKCGSLPCGPYINNREVTCAVCSYEP